MDILERYKKRFENHNASYKDLGEVQILDWKKEGTIINSIRFLFNSNKLLMSKIIV